MSAIKIKRIILYLFLISFVVSQEMPGQPHIAWMPTEYTMQNDSVNLTFIWDMWWGVNGDHWKLSKDGFVIYEIDIESYSPNAQHDETQILLDTTGELTLTVHLCNGSGESELCNASVPQFIIIHSDDGGTDEIDHGQGVVDWGSRFFSPFLDATGWPPISLSNVSIQTGVKYFNLGFIVDRTGSACEANWGGYYGLDGWTLANDFMFPLIENNEIGALRQLGGDVMVSIGGAANTPLASACEDVESLVQQIQMVIDTYDLAHLDFDIEGIWVLDDDATERRSLAVSQVQQNMENQNRPINIWYTLPVLPEGLTSGGIQVVDNALQNGVNLAGINIMAMDYGNQVAVNPEGQMGEYAIQAAQSLHAQLTELFENHNIDKTDEEIWAMVGVTPMIGMNDVTTEVFELEDADQLSDFGINMNMGMLSMWSVNRDKQCDEGEIDHVDILCSSILQDEFEFSAIFNTFSENQGVTFERNIVGYFVSWGVYARNYEVSDIPSDKINFINYAFANINPSSGTIMVGDPYADIDQFYPGDCWDDGCLRGNFHQLQILKEQHPHIKTLISVGGWTWSGNFSAIAMTEQSREIFSQSCVDFIMEYGFDGIDLDWEYPVEGGLPGNNHHPDDGIHLTLLLQRMREILDELEEETGNHYYLTIAASANPVMVDHLELEALSEILDWINIMSYDFHGPWSGEGNLVTNFNSPLYPTEEDPTPEPYNSQFNLSASVQNYIERGVPPEKLHAGLAFYGRSFGGVENVNNGLYQPYSGVPTDGTWEDGVFDFYDLDNNYIDMNGYLQYWNEAARVSWLYNPRTQIMISYDDVQSIHEKAEYICAMELGGAMFWEFSGDRGHGLLNKAYEILVLENDYSPEFISGDLNGDLELNVIDIVMAINLILSDQFDPVGDLNEDSFLNIVDIVILVNMILEN